MLNHNLPGINRASYLSTVHTDFVYHRAFPLVTIRSPFPTQCPCNTRCWCISRREGNDVEFEDVMERPEHQSLIRLVGKDNNIATGSFDGRPCLHAVGTKFHAPAVLAAKQHHGQGVVHGRHLQILCSDCEVWQSAIEVYVEQLPGQNRTGKPN